jgi:hypothetical protein
MIPLSVFEVIKFLLNAERHGSIWNTIPGAVHVALIEGLRLLSVTA